METRYIEEYTYPEDLPAKDRTSDKAIIVKIPYEVSDEKIEAEITAEAREIAIRKIAEKEKTTIREQRRLLR